MSDPTRRALLAAAGAAAATPALAQVPAPPTRDWAALARDEAYWARVAGLYDPPPAGVVQLENGHFGAMTRPTRAAYEQATARVNRETTLYTRGPVNPDMSAVRARVAALLEVSTEEIVFTRGATESLQILIGGYNRLRPGDAVLYADLDYDAMQAAMEWLRERRGVRVVKIDLPEPATRQAVIDAYEAALKANPDVRMMLLTHLSHRTGLIPPVAEICALARARGVDVILDGGHALGQTEFRMADLGAPFAGLNLHKWIGAPLGVGLIYIAKDRIGDIDVSMSEPPGPKIDARVHTGTVNFAAVLATAQAIDVHQAIGIEAKAHRLRRLRDLWAEEMRAHPAFEILTPADPTMHAGLTSFRLKGRTSGAENVALRKQLFETHRIFTVERHGPARGACVRVTPSFINTAEDIARLTAALKSLPTG
jgi:selenocysteine lyase/cysteine desulfurase